ncbi:replication endonuclease [Enterovibrio norvegicus]|uniref:replication endonuclease n=1 Tax=Enterovibrio norvegicus TaxID=188144 RepID=UPI0024B233B1|nr:replication endonuclease [Enterovibrio norvegicus]
MATITASSNRSHCASYHQQGVSDFSHQVRASILRDTQKRLNTRNHADREQCPVWDAVQRINIPSSSLSLDDIRGSHVQRFDTHDGWYTAARDGSDDTTHWRDRLPVTKSWRERLYDAVRPHPDFSGAMIGAFQRMTKKRDYLTAISLVESANQRLSLPSLRLSSSDEELAESARVQSRRVMRLVAGVKDDDIAFDMVTDVLSGFGLSFDKAVIEAKTKAGELRALVNRACSDLWWRRQLRRKAALQVESVSRDLEMVHKGASAYCSGLTLARSRFRREQTRQVLNETIAYDVEDESVHFSLFELAGKSVSNPVVRRAEMFVRLRGFEQIAQECGHAAAFITLTAPSRFHAVSNGQANQKWLDAGRPSVLAAQDHLNGVFINIRRELDKSGIKMYGMRVVEPHHDGCPHWHLLVFAAKSDMKRIQEVHQRHALSDTPNERGAQKRRCTIEDINWSRGSAVGYVAKYLSKNIDGAHIDSDKDTELDGASAAERVCVWARTHGIRQFQFFGGPSVTVWRELRRIRQEFKEDDTLFADLTPTDHLTLENVRRAADASDWAAFCHAMGGVFVRRDQQVVKPHYHVPHIFDQLMDDYTPQTTRYGDKVTARVNGLMFHHVFLLTRFKTWKMESKQTYVTRQKRIMSDVVDIFDVLEREEEYRRMADDKYDEAMRYQERFEELVALSLCEEWEGKGECPPPALLDLCQ